MPALHRLDLELGLADVGEQAMLGVGVGREVVDGDDHRHAETAHVAHVATEVDEAALQRGEVLPAEVGDGDAAVEFQRPHGRDDDHCVGLEPRLPALDVEELLGAEVGAEAGLGDRVVAELERRARRDHRVAAVGDVGERAAVDQCRRALDRLHQVGLDRVLEQRRHRPGRLQRTRRDRPPIARVGDDDARQTLLEIGEIGGEAQARHHLGGDRDVEAALAHEAVRAGARRPAEPDRHRAQRSVVHVDDAAPDDAARVDGQRVAPVHVVVDQRREQVVRRGDGVEVAGEVEVDALHRHHLGAAAAGRTALGAEHRSERRLAQRDHGALADAVERVAEADRGCRLAFAGRRRIDRGDEHELAVGAAA